MTEVKPKKPTLGAYVEELEKNEFIQLQNMICETAFLALQEPESLLERIPELEDGIQRLTEAAQQLHESMKPVAALTGFYRLLVVQEKIMQDTDPRSEKHKNADHFHRALQQNIQRLGAKILGSEKHIGQPFDPAWQVIRETQESSDQFPAGSVIRILSHGLRLGDELILPAFVAVADSPEEGGNES